ncbi:MAG: hypothetical protein GXP22_08845 [Gammaproteobacteria bacterium]|nr:hypothetical protein [Gammaproteobacteria bacterium]
MNKSPERKSYQDYQHQFAQHLRNSAVNPAPEGADPQRMQVYEDLIFNNFNSFLLNCFPITHDILGNKAWHKLTKQGFAESHSPSPLFRDIPATFLAWLQTKTTEPLPQYPWLYEFMHYEWIELSVKTDTADLDTVVIPDQSGDRLDNKLVLNPTAQLACYHWPVHTISPDNSTPVISEQAHCFLIFRKKDDEVHFIEVNPLTAQLIQQLQESSEQPLRQILKKLANTVYQGSVQDLETAIPPLLTSLQQQELILS